MNEVSNHPLWDPRRPAAPPPSGARCEGCAWLYRGGRGRPVTRCRRHDGARVEEAWPACPAFEAVLDCAECGACCREAFHVVEVSARDPFRRLHGDLLNKRDGRWQLARNDLGRCPCLSGEAGTFRCRVYEDRPRSCRDFELGSANCVEARRRVGLTP